LGLGIVAGSELWILEAALNIDHEKRTLSDHAPDPTSCSADADQLLVDELVGPVAAELASEAGAFRSAERQLGTVCADDVHVDHAGVDPVRDAIGLLRVVRHHV